MPVRVRQKFFQSASFIRYWLQAMNQHSLHPPFIFNLYTKAIKKECQDPLFGEIEQARKNLLKNPQTVDIFDLGAGSSISAKKKRRISEIARFSLTKPDFSRLLYRLIRYMKADTVLELGTSLGINTLYLSAAAPQGTIYTLEGCPQTANVALETFSEWKNQNIRLLKGNIDNTLPDLLHKTNLKIDAAYLDANHTYTASLNYFKLLLPHLHENSFLVLDDIHWSKEMHAAWKEICQHPRVSLSLDLYDAGILFFQTGIRKEHYVLEV